MDRISVPHKVQRQIVTFEGDWTAEEIDAGLAGSPTNTEIEEVWYEPSPNGPIEVTDADRIQELERRLASQE